MNRHFQLFGQAEQFDIDQERLGSDYRTLAARFHPDKFASATPFEQKQAVMMAAAVNEAYRVLKHPLDRAAYLLQAQGIDADAPQHTGFAPEFLMQQMEWREAIADARAEADHATLQTLLQEIESERSRLLAQLRTAFSDSAYEHAAQLVRQGRFLDKLGSEIRAALP